MFGKLRDAAMNMAAKVAKTPFVVNGANEDDARLAANLLLTAASADGKIDTEEADLFEPVMESIFPGFKTAQISNFLQEAARSHSPLASIGHARTARLFKEFRDDDNHLELIVPAVCEVVGGVDDPREYDVLKKVFDARTGFDATRHGFPARRPGA